MAQNLKSANLNKIHLGGEPATFTRGGNGKKRGANICPLTGQREQNTMRPGWTRKDEREKRGGAFLGNLEHLRGRGWGRGCTLKPSTKKKQGGKSQDRSSEKNTGVSTGEKRGRTPRECNAVTGGKRRKGQQSMGVLGGSEKKNNKGGRKYHPGLRR